MHVVACMWVYLHKQWYGLHAGDLSSVYGVSGQNVKRSCAALYYFLHTNTILVTETDRKTTALKKEINKLTEYNY